MRIALRTVLWLAPVLATVPVWADPAPAQLKLIGPWQIEVRVQSPPIVATVDVAPAELFQVKGEVYSPVPLFNEKAWGGWQKGAALRAVKAQECTNRGLLVPESLVVRSGAQRFELGKDYAADLEWGSFGRLPQGRIAADQPVEVDYQHGLLRIDSIVLDGGRVTVRQGKPHPAAPLPPGAEGQGRLLANVFVAGRLAKLGPEHLFPVLETAYPEPPKTSPTPVEQWAPKALAKLRSGQALRLLAWGDSVTACGYLPAEDRWQAQFVRRLEERFPQAKIELVTEAWGGRNTASYLAEPPGSQHNYQEKVLGAKPDLVVSEFVNDAGLSPEQVETRYGKLLADFRRVGAEWIILTPHYVRIDWMGLTSERQIDQDPRPYVTGLRQFSEKHQVPLADASLRWGRLWRQGIPFSTLHLNSINHPDARGMKLFVDSLMAVFP